MMKNQLRGLLRTQAALIIPLILLQFLASAVLSVASPYLLTFIAAQDENSRLFILFFVLAFLAAAGCGWASGRLRFYLEKRLLFGCEDYWIDNLIQHYGKAYTLEGVQSKFRSTLPELVQNVSSFLVQVPAAACTFVLISVFLLRMDPVSYGVSLGLSILFCFLAAHKGNKVSDITSQRENDRSLVRGHLFEQIENTEIVKLLNGQTLKEDFGRLTAKYLHDTVQYNRISSRSALIEQYAPVLQILLITGISFLFSLSRSYAVLFLTLPYLCAMILRIPGYRNRYYEMKGQLESIEASLLEGGPAPSLETPDRITRITAEDLTFSYTENGPLSVDHVSFTYHTPGILVLAGASGSGKSTLLRLLSRTAEGNGRSSGTEGKIYYNEADLSQLDTQSLYSKVFYQKQTPYLFQGTIRDNLTLGLPVEESRLQAALELLKLDKPISQGEKGLDTPLQDTNFSSGEKQKLIAARILFRDWDVLLCDEATSAMDTASEKQFLEALSRLAHQEGRLVVMAGHRDQVLRMSDHILFLQNGKLEAQGSYETLCQTCLAFQTMIARTKDEN